MAHGSASAAPTHATAAQQEEETSGWKKFGLKQEEIASSGTETRVVTAKAAAQENEEDDNPFSQYYGMLLHQQNMLQDHVRTSTYERAMLENAADFANKVV